MLPQILFLNFLSYFLKLLSCRDCSEVEAEQKLLEEVCLAIHIINVIHR